MSLATAARLLVGWGSAIAFMLFGSTLHGGIGSPGFAVLLFAWLFGVILWSALGTVAEAEHLAETLGRLRYREQAYNFQGAAAFLAVIIPLSIIALVLPNFTRSTPDGTLTPVAASTIGLTVPAILGIGLATDQRVLLGLAPAEMVLLSLTLIFSTLTFSGPRTTVLEGAMHLVVFFVYLTLIFDP